MEKANVLFRVDGDSVIGLGHIHRCVAIAEMIDPFFKSTFCIRNPLPRIKALLEHSGFDVVEMNPSLNLAEEADELSSALVNFEIVVLDGYLFDTSYQRAIKKAGVKLVCIDDIHSYHFVSDAIINHAGGVTPSMYSAERYTKFYLGISFSLVKKPFRNISIKRELISNREDAVFISLGGADVQNTVVNVLKECEQRVPNRKYYVVLGEAYKHNESFQNFIGSTNLKMTTFFGLSSDEMAQIMMRCKIAICSPSGVAYEYLSVGGELYVCQTAPNQLDLQQYLLNNHLSFLFDEYPVRNSEKLSKMNEAQKKVFDGLAAKRIARIFLDLYFDKSCILRRAVMKDMLILFNWSNETETRRLSFNSEPISWEVHQAWYSKKLSDKNTHLYILEYKKQPIGQIRFDIFSETIVSYAIDKKFRGLGLGTMIIQMGIQQFKKDTDFSGTITGYVKKENVNSIKIFSNLGFTSSEAKDKNNAYKFELKV